MFEFHELGPLFRNGFTCLVIKEFYFFSIKRFSFSCSCLRIPCIVPLFNSGLLTGTIRASPRNFSLRCDPLMEKTFHPLSVKNLMRTFSLTEASCSSSGSVCVLVVLCAGCNGVLDAEAGLLIFGGRRFLHFSQVAAWLGRFISDN